MCEGLEDMFQFHNNQVKSVFINNTYVSIEYERFGSTRK